MIELILTAVSVYAVYSFGFALGYRKAAGEAAEDLKEAADALFEVEGETKDIKAQIEERIQRQAFQVERRRRQ